MGILIVGLAILVAIPALTYATMMQSHRVAWLPRMRTIEHVEEAGQGAFRRGEVRQIAHLWSRGGMPVVLRVAAVSCVVMGQMLIPGLLAAALGLAVMLDDHGRDTTINVLLASSIPGTAVAVAVWRAGLSLFRGNYAEAQQRTRVALAATWALNVPLFAFALLAVSNHLGGYEFAFVTLGYAPVSLAQSVFVAYALHRSRDAFADASAPIAAVDSAPAPAV